MDTITTTLYEYEQLLGEIDTWFRNSAALNNSRINCCNGCSQCCRGLFDITILDAALLNKGFRTLPETVKKTLTQRAQERMALIRSVWSQFSPPYMFNHRSEDEIEAILASDNETPCPLLDENGSCLLYKYRPMTCRLHGIPLVDISGEIMESDWCTLNFTDLNPLKLDSIKGEFREYFSREGALGRLFTKDLTGMSLNEMDTLIPAAILVDFDNFDWKEWLIESQLRT